MADVSSLPNKTVLEYNKLGESYLKGQSTSINYKKAAEYFTKAANQGNIDAQQLRNIPKSTVHNNQETYELSCPNNSQHTSEDMADCVYTMTKQLDVIQNKYLITIKLYIQRQYNNNPALLKETLIAFEQENKAWEKLIKAASSATYSYNEDGSWRGIVANSRALELMKYRIHNQWRNWLIFTNKVSEYDPPEPMFKINN